jgi:hypothetical protein
MCVGPTERWERRHELLLCPPCILQFLLLQLGLMFTLQLLADALFGLPV